jgi:hypothetical protein
MPIFEYRCQHGHITEEFVTPSLVNTPGARSTVCVRCSSEGNVELAEKILSATPTTFKHNDRTSLKKTGR